MRKRAAGLIGIVGVWGLAASAANAYTLNSPEGKFTAEFPAPTVMFRSQGQTAKGIHYEEFRWSTFNKDGYWGVAMFVYATPRRLDYDANIGGAVAAAKGRLASQRSVQQSGVEGREILIEGPKSGVVRERILWIRDRLYFVVFGGAKPVATSPEVDKFLDSFAAAGK